MAATVNDLTLATHAFIQAAKRAAGPQASSIRLAIVGGTAIIQTTKHRTTQV